MLHIATNKEVKAMLFSIDATSNKDFYIILKDGKEFVKVSKRKKLEDVKKHFGIKVVENAK